MGPSQRDIYPRASGSDELFGQKDQLDTILDHILDSCNDGNVDEIMDLLEKLGEIEVEISSSDDEKIKIVSFGPD